MACGTIAALTALGAGTGASEYASSREQGAMDSTLQNSLNRNQGFVNQAQPVFQQSLANSTPGAASQQMQQGAQQALGYTQAAGLPSATLSLPQNTNPQNAGNVASAAGQQTRNMQSNMANANLVGQSNYGLQQSLGNMAANRQLGLLGNEAQSWQNILPYQLQAAGQSQTGLSDLGSLLSSIGGLGLTASLTRRPPQSFGAPIGGAPLYGSGAQPLNPYSFANFGE